MGTLNNSNNYKFTLYLGLNDKDTKQQKISTLEAYKIVSNMIASQFDGGTIFEALGIYKHDDGTIVKETTLRIELIFVRFEEVKVFASSLKSVFNQETIAVDKQIITSELL